MSNKYQYYAKKRNSYPHFEATTICKYGQPNNCTRCKTCLIRTGRTRRIQKDKVNVNINK
jgi:hypothetical protein